jgi:membrane dipeptidase
MSLLVDAHSDIAWNALTFGRDVTQSALVTRQREQGTPIPARNHGQALVGWPEWLLGRVAVVLASLFVPPARRVEGNWETLCYQDAEQADRLLRRQVDFYRQLAGDHEDKFRLVRNQEDLRSVLIGWEGESLRSRRVGLVLMMEGAEAVRHPDELDDWHSWGVRIVAPAWAATRYAGGTGEPGPFTRRGRMLLEAMHCLGMMLDLTHLDDAAVMEALERYPGILLASHSNPRALADSLYPNRHLTDEAIRLLAERGGVMGIVPYNRFLKKGWDFADGRVGITLDTVVAHVDYVCQLVGDAEHVGLGSDFDGGFGLESIPLGLDTVADLRLIGGALLAHGYSPEEIEAVLGGNWLRLLRHGLPET